ncbi:MAG TPA: CoA transferase [Sphingomicrobium sp.]|nr:CoA transferase [Sphingomicrobium sp.]
MYRLLNGFKIVEAASFIAAPFCTLTFAQLGADVIRIDPIGGGPDFHRWPLAPSGASLYWEGLNKGKRSIAIDLARPEGRELAVALVTRSGPSTGHFVTNYPASSFFAHDKLAARRPDLITVRVTGSSDGRNAVDYTVNCAAGYPWMTGPADMKAPVNHVLPAWDVTAGLTAAVALLAAAQTRAQTGEGREIKVPLSNVAFGVLSALGNLAEVSIMGKDRPSYGNALYGSFGRDFLTADRRRLMIVAITRRQWTGLIAVLGLASEIAALESRLGADFAADEGLRFIHRKTLFDLVEQRVSARQLKDLAEAFDRHAVCWGEYHTVGEALQQDARLTSANPMFEPVAQPSGETYLAAGFPGVIATAERMSIQPARRLGADTDAILSEELGLKTREIGRLHDLGIVAESDKADGYA